MEQQQDDALETLLDNTKEMADRARRAHDSQDAEHWSAAARNLAEGAAAMIDALRPKRP